MTGVGVKPSSRWMTRLDAVGGEHFEGGALRRAGEGVRVLAHEERAVDALLAAVLADGLGDGEDVGLGEGAVDGAAAMAAGAEGDALRRIVRVRRVAIGVEQRGHVHQHGGGGRLAGQGVSHDVSYAGWKRKSALALLSPAIVPFARSRASRARRRR